VRCPFCQKNPFLWKASFGIRELLRLVKLPVSANEPVRISTLERTPSGRIAMLRLEAGDQERRITSDQFRSLLGYTRIKSALFDWRVSDNEIEFEGRGAGHGVGMCQWGARYLARQGRSYAQILGYYYPGLQLYGASSNKTLE
jgi:stage II sporulation protein D